MKKQRRAFFVISMLFCLTFGVVSAQAATTTTTTSTKKTTVKNGWKKESAGWCYYV